MFIVFPSYKDHTVDVMHIILESFWLNKFGIFKKILS